MLDPGKYFAEAIYFVLYAIAKIVWAINRALLSIAVISEAVSGWISDNISYFVQLLVNALSAPLGGMLILAMTALGCWYALNSVVATERWVDPSKLVTYGFIALFFFSSPILVIDMLEELRLALNAGIDPTLIEDATGDIFTTAMNGTDVGLPNAIPDANSDGFIGAFDLVAAFMLVANLDELDSNEFPLDFEATFFPFGDPSSIDLSDEADRELAKSLAIAGLERLFFAAIAIPTAIAEHFLRLALTGVAMLLYAGVPFALLFAFFIYTQAFLGAYLRQFINLLIETLLSVIIVAIMITLLATAAQQGIGLYIGASLIALIVLVWRILSALKLAGAAFDLFGGAVISGGSGGRALARLGQRAVTTTVGVAGAALTGGAAVAAGGALLAAGAAMQPSNEAGSQQAARTAGRARQLKTVAGYTLGRNETVRRVVEGGHEVRTLARNFRAGDAQEQAADTLDYMRAGASMSGFGSSPWLAMRLSPSLRNAYDQLGGTAGRGGHPLAAAAYRDGASSNDEGAPVVDSRRRASTIPASIDTDTRQESNEGGEPSDRSDSAESQAVTDPRSSTETPGSAETQRGSEQSSSNGHSSWRTQPATPRQREVLTQGGVEPPAALTRGAASDLIAQQQAQRAEQSPSNDAAAHTNSWRRQSSAAETAPALAARFDTLEQALVNLTHALTTANEGGAAGRDGRLPILRDVGVVRGGQASIDASNSAESQDDTQLPSDVNNTPRQQNISASEQEQRLPRQPVTSSQASPKMASPERPEDMRPANQAQRDATALNTGSQLEESQTIVPDVRFAPHSAQRQQQLGLALQQLGGSESPSSQLAYRQLATTMGTANATAIQAAVTQHTSASVTAVSAAIVALVDDYRSRGVSEAAIVQTFHSGEAASGLRQATEVPLNDIQLAAVADLTLQPQRVLTRHELVATIGSQAQENNPTADDVAVALQTPVGFGAQTGNVRGVLTGTKALQLNPAELTDLSDLIRDGLREQAVGDLQTQGHPPEAARTLVADIAALPETLSVPQSLQPPTIADRSETSNEDAHE